MLNYIQLTTKTTILSLMKFMNKSITILLFLLFSLTAKAQYKPDVIVIGGSAAGTAAAIQAAQSGVKVLLIESSSQLIGDVTPDMDIPNFNQGIWKTWRDAYKKAKDSIVISPQLVLEELVLKTKKLQLLKSTAITQIEQKKNGWELSVLIHGKEEKIKCKILVDASTDSGSSILVKNKILKLNEEGKFDALVNYSKAQHEQPYDQLQKLYRTSGAAGFGKDSSIFYIPLGVFIPKDQDNLLIVSMSSFKDFDTEDLRNIALWTNMGQAAGALAAYGPFFDVSPKEANIRLTQGEMITYKSFLYPVLDVRTDEYAWYAIQKVIASGMLKLDFNTGMFHADSLVLASEMKTILSELYPRSRIWFIENKVEHLSVNNLVSLLSFISGRDPISIMQEVENDWSKKYKFATVFSHDKMTTKREAACLLDNYIAPFNVNVNFSGYDLR